MSKHYFASDGNYGDGDLVVILDTTHWGPVDWARIESASDDQRWTVAKRIDEGIAVYRVTYSVKLIHEILIEAKNEYHARERFEELYSQGLDVNEIDIDHEIDDVEDVEDLSSYDTVHTLDD